MYKKQAVFTHYNQTHLLTETKYTDPQMKSSVPKQLTSILHLDIKQLTSILHLDM